MPRSTRLAAGLAGLSLAAASALAQTSPAFGPPSAPVASTTTGDMPLADYLALLQKIAPAAGNGARTYLAAVQLRCRHTLTTAELRQAIADGNSTLMGLIRAAQLQDPAARSQLVAQLSCPNGSAR